jgi:hypothetical protein
VDPGGIVVIIIAACSRIQLSAPSLSRQSSLSRLVADLLGVANAHRLDEREKERERERERERD